MKITVSEPINLHHGIIILKNGTRVLLVETEEKQTYNCYVEPPKETLP